MMSRTMPCPTTGCWLWEGTTSLGYGVVRISGVDYRAHRVSYELFRGPIPSGLVMDHVCRVKSCINPYHLSVCTVGENVAVEADRRLFCRNNKHLMRTHTGYVKKANGKTVRLCLGCSRERQAKYHEANPLIRKEAARKDREKHRDKRLADKKEYYLKNRERLLEKQRAYEKIRYAKWKEARELAIRDEANGL